MTFLIFLKIDVMASLLIAKERIESGIQKEEQDSQRSL